MPILFLVYSNWAEISSPAGITDIKKIFLEFGLLLELFQLKPGGKIISTDFTLLHFQRSFPPDDRPLILVFLHPNDIYRTGDHAGTASDTTHRFTLKGWDHLPPISTKGELDG